jgi:predicted regulator of Ras-like GTPase activity (Roadblock/LC7/MglB family)
MLYCATLDDLSAPMTEGMDGSMALPALSTEQHGFVGAVSDMSLADIIQVKGSNRYSGSLVVEHRGNTGVIYFRDGEIVHAEQATLAGEEAFYAVMGWVGGTFRSEPKVSTTSRTIDQPLGFLILEALRRMDEAKKSSKQGQPAEATSSREGSGMSEIGTKLSVIPEIEKALVMTKDGSVVDDTSYQAELLAANGLFLALFSSQIGSQLGIGELKSATVHGNEHHLFLFDSKRHHLCVSAKGSANVNSLDSEIRRVLAQK